MPDTRGVSRSGLREVRACATPRPVGPPHDITMMDRVVVNVVEGGPEVAVRTHRALDGTEEHFAATGVLFAVPRVRSSSVMAAELTQEDEDIGSLDERVVVIRQHAPSVNLTRVGRQHVDKCRAKIVEPCGAVPYVRSVFVARSSKVKTEMTVIGPVGWRVPRVFLTQTRSEQFGALCRCEAAPYVTGARHDRTVSGVNADGQPKFKKRRIPPKGGTPNSDNRAARTNSRLKAPSSARPDRAATSPCIRQARANSATPASRRPPM